MLRRTGRHKPSRAVANLRAEALEDRRLLAVLTVENLNDSGPGSLREAIVAANAAPGADEITFALPGTIALESQLPVITDSLTLTGLGAEQTILDAGNGADGEFGTGDGYRLLDINDGDSDTTIDVTLTGLTLTGGDIPEVGGQRKSGEDGGGIRSTENVTVIDSRIIGNAAGPGSQGILNRFCATSSACHGPGEPIYNYLDIQPGVGGRGGGVWVEGADLQIVDSLVANNRSGRGGTKADPIPDDDYPTYGAPGGDGGGIGIADGTLTVTQSTIQGNQTGDSTGSSPFYLSGGESGGGIYSLRSEVHIVGSLVDSNVAPRGGGGLGIAWSDAFVRQSTFSNNTATQEDGSAIAAPFPTFSNHLELDNSTVSGNRGNYSIARIFDGAIQNSTIVDNSAFLDVRPTNAGGIQLFGGLIDGSVIAGNDAYDVFRDTSGAEIEVKNSLIGVLRESPNSTAPAIIDGVSGNQVGTAESPLDPLLGPLADNGGPTPTHALLPGSPALNAGDPNATPGVDGVPVNDQRGPGFSRVLGGRIDAGAFEADTPPPPAAGGDFNGDGFVDWLDNQAWRTTYGATVTPYAGADANGNGRIDAADFTAWRDHHTPRDTDILRAESTPTIDGVADAVWASAPVGTIGNTVFGTVDSPGDASATWRALWDDTALYLYAEILDERLVRDSSIAFEDDGLEAFFDLDLSRGTTYDGVDDIQYMFRLADTTPVASPDSAFSSTFGVMYATGGNPNGAGYTIEAAIPWRRLGYARPVAGDRFGFELALQDDDNGGGISNTGEDGRRQWHGTSNRAFFDPSEFGIAALSPRVATVPNLSQAATATPTTPPLYDMAGEGAAAILVDPGNLTNFTPPAQQSSPATLRANASQPESDPIALASIEAPEAQRPETRPSRRITQAPPPRTAFDIRQLLSDQNDRPAEEEAEELDSVDRWNDQEEPLDSSTNWHNVLDNAFAQLN